MTLRPLHLLCLCCLFCCVSLEAFAQKKALKYLPKPIRSLPFETSLREAMRLQPLDISTEPSSFRVIATWKAPPSPFSQIVMYFDKDGDQPLYEYILSLPSETACQQLAFYLLGLPNYEGREWRYPTREGYTLWAWMFEQKLVLVAMLPHTEWTE